MPPQGEGCIELLVVEDQEGLEQEGKQTSTKRRRHRGVAGRGLFDVNHRLVDLPGRFLLFPEAHGASISVGR